MSGTLKSYYDEFYATDPMRFGTMPLGIVRVALEEQILSPKSHVLVIGGGQGRNTFPFARKGHAVSVIDISSVAVEQMNKEAQRNGLSLYARQGDIFAEGIAGIYDMIVCAFLLHFYPRAQSGGLLREIKEHTAFDGFNAIAAFTTKGDFYREAAGRDLCYFLPGELGMLYAYWNHIIPPLEQWGGAVDTRADGKPKWNLSVHILARKP